MNYILVVVAALIAVLYAQTQCDCDLGIYAKNANGKCTGELKHFDTPEFGLGCLPMYVVSARKPATYECQCNVVPCVQLRRFGVECRLASCFRCVCI